MGVFISPQGISHAGPSFRPTIPSLRPQQLGDCEICGLTAQRLFFKPNQSSHFIQKARVRARVCVCTQVGEEEVCTLL